MASNRQSTCTNVVARRIDVDYPQLFFAARVRTLERLGDGLAFCSGQAKSLGAGVGDVLARLEGGGYGKRELAVLRCLLELFWGGVVDPLRNSMRSWVSSESSSLDVVRAVSGSASGSRTPARRSETSACSVPVDRRVRVSARDAAAAATTGMRERVADGGWSASACAVCPASISVLPCSLASTTRPSV